jgi:hypothetical protein
MTAPALKTAPTQPRHGVFGTMARSEPHPEPYGPHAPCYGLLRANLARYAASPTSFPADISGGAGLWPGAAGHQGGRVRDRSEA